MHHGNDGQGFAHAARLLDKGKESVASATGNKRSGTDGARDQVKGAVKDVTANIKDAATHINDAHKDD
jgi:uncharacterized protein YjbJ (UPF0337 family)